MNDWFRCYVRAPYPLIFVRAFALVVAGGSVGQTAAVRAFSPAVRLDTSFNPFVASAGVDDGGNAIVVWSGNGNFYAMHAAGHGWSAAMALSQRTVPGGSPIVQMTAGGNATIVSYTSGVGIFAADKPARGNFGDAVRIVNAPSLTNTTIDVPLVQFLANVRGDQAIVYEDDVNGVYRLLAARRPASTSVWGTARVIVTSATVGRFAVAAAAIGAQGDVVITGETFTVACSRSCHENNFVVHALRATPASDVWRDSGALTAPGFAYSTRTAIDPQGHAVVLIHPAYTGVVTANTQLTDGARWSRAATVVSPSTFRDATLASSDAMVAGFGTLAVTGVGAGSGHAVGFVDGNLVTNTWAAPTNLGTLDRSSPDGNIAVGSNTAGGNLAQWTDFDGTLRASLRPALGVAWTSPVTLIAGSACAIATPCTLPIAAALNNRGDSVLLFSRVNTEDTSSSNLYAITR